MELCTGLNHTVLACTEYKANSTPTHHNANAKTAGSLEHVVLRQKAKSLWRGIVVCRQYAHNKKKVKRLLFLMKTPAHHSAQR